MSLAAFDRIWTRMHVRDGELRPRLVEWIKKIVPITGPNVPLAVRGAALERDDGWRCQLFLQPGRKSKSKQFHEFPIAPVVPEKLSAADFQELGLVPKLQMLVPMAWLLEVLGQAWVEAGLTLPFSLGNFPFLGQRFRHTDHIRASAYRVTAPLPPSIPTLPAGQVDLVAPPAPLSLPDTTPSLRSACIAGEPGAVRVWADALDDKTADLLRWVDGFADTVTDRVRTWAGHGAFWVYANASADWWGTGEEGTEPDGSDETAARLAQLLTGWNVYYPAVEWLLRRLRLSIVTYRGAYFADGLQGQTFEVDLENGGHLAPVDATMGVAELHGEFRVIDHQDE